MDNNEKSRLAAVYSLNLLDTAPEDRFDRITRLAKCVLGVETAIVSLMDADRQWFKAVCGFDASEVTRKDTFCDMTIRLGQLLVIPDATNDARVSGNPFVTAENGIRFYAGYPIVSSGEIVGTFCVADPTARDLSGEQLQAFVDLGAMAQDEMIKLAMASAAVSTLGQLNLEQTRVRQLVDEVAKRKLAQSLLAENEERLRTVLETSLNAFVCTDTEGVVLEWNAAAVEIFGWLREEVIGRRLVDTIIPERFHQMHNLGMERYLQDGTGPIIGKRIEIPARTKRGDEIIVEMTVNDYALRGTKYIGAFLHDITDRNESRAKLAESEDRLRTIADNLPVLIALLDRDRRYVFANPRFLDWFGVDPKDLIGKSVHAAFGVDGSERWQPAFDSALAANASEFELAVTFGEQERVIHTLLLPRQGGPGINGLYVLATDVTQQRQHEQHLEGLALSDSLTGLPNRRSFDDALKQAIAKGARSGVPVTVAYLDVDKFKYVNDAFGHAVGDEVLQEFARRLTASVRATDQVFRLAGDEFTMIFDNIAEIEDCSSVGENILAKINEPFFLSMGTYSVSASLGIAWCDDVAPEAGKLRQFADQALYTSKESGRGRATVVRA